MFPYFFSIIIPTFNSERTLIECLSSVLSQTFGNYEVLVIDGGSVDSTVNILKSAGFGSKMQWITESDEGIYDAMNKGIRMARGEWLFFLGSDDFFYDSKVLTDVKDQIDRHATSKFIYGDVFTSDGYIQKFESFSFDVLIQKNICHQAIFYHSSLFSAIQYDVRLKLLADWDFNLKVYRPSNYPVYIPRVISGYSMNGVSSDWLKGPEYKNSFSNKKHLIVKYRGLIAYYQYLVRRYILMARKRLKLALNGNDRTHVF